MKDGMKISFKYAVPIVVFMIVFAGGSVPAKGDGLPGFGVILSEPTGVSVKIIRGRFIANDLAVGLSGWKGGFHLHGDFLFHGVVRERYGRMLFAYCGIGARFKAKLQEVGARLPLGISYMLISAEEPVALDFFLEVVPTYDVLRDGKL